MITTVNFIIQVYVSAVQVEECTKIDVIAETWVEDWRREGAFDFVSKVLRENGDKVHGIIAE